MSSQPAFAESFSVEGKRIGAGARCFVIAEAGVNHNGDLNLAKQLIDAAHQAGADAVKFQTFKSDKVVSLGARKAEYQARETEVTESQLDMVRKLELSFDDFRELQQYAHNKGIIFLSTAFDAESADFLEELGVAAFKIPSGEITNLDFIRHVASKRCPLVVSTGMSALAEVRCAVAAIAEAGKRELALMQCVSNYPAEARDINLHAMHSLRKEFSCPVGFSDHTLGPEIALAAVALGAKVLEKHLTLDRKLPGPDHRASMEPKDFGAMIGALRNVEAALGDGVKRPAKSEAEVAEVARRSLVAAADVRAGAMLRESDVAVLRPGSGLPPAMRSQIVGRRAKRDIAKGELLALEMLQ